MENTIDYNRKITLAVFPSAAHRYEHVGAVCGRKFHWIKVANTLSVLTSWIGCGHTEESAWDDAVKTAKLIVQKGIEN